MSIGVDTEAVGRALLQGALNNAIGGDGSQSLEDTARNALRDAIGLGSPDTSDDGTDEDAEPVDPAQQLLQGLLNSSRSRDTEPDEETTDEGPN